MNTRFPFPRMVGLLISVSLVCVVLVMAAQAVPLQKSAQKTAPAGLLTLLPAVPGGKGELPPVPFDHDKHTKAVQNAGKDCAACHEPVTASAEDAAAKETISYKFKDAGSKSSKALKDRFHDGCISCHAKPLKNSKRTGPLEAECRSCHIAASPSKSAERFMPAFDSSLHYRHISSPDITAPQENPGIIAPANCAACHHPVPGMAPAQTVRDSCRSCHTPLAPVAHDSCISCHRAVTKAKKPSGPVDCAGCHTAKTWNNYAKLVQVPRLPAGQPVARLLTPKPRPEDGKQTPAVQATMPPVPFNHALHEKALPSCRSCHHETMQACSSCHTMGGIPKGRGVTLPKAMHKPDAAYSCVGCHEQRKTTLPECAGCHTPKAAALVKPDCAFCHKPVSRSKPIAPVSPAIRPPATLPDTAAAGTLPPPAQPAAEKPQGPPEVVIISPLAREYGPAILPHGAIIRALEKGIKNASPSLSAMHAANSTACQGCHHNSPATATPPKCASCHDTAMPLPTATQRGAPLPPDGRPLLKAAYHQQCMDCHSRMQVKKPANTDCESCHAKAAKTKP